MDIRSTFEFFPDMRSVGIIRAHFGIITTFSGHLPLYHKKFMDSFCRPVVVISVHRVQLLNVIGDDVSTV